MEVTEAVFAVAAALFVYSFFRMTARLRQFATYERSYGAAPRISIDELVALAEAAGRDPPAFTVMVPAWRETETIAATMRRIAAVSYPASLLDLVVVAYADEPPGPDGRTTAEVAEAAAAEINRAAGRRRARIERTPADFDGFFPGAFGAAEPHVGKARGLNYGLRRLHERIEADETATILGLGGAVETRPETPEFLRAVAEETSARPAAELKARAKARLEALARSRPRLAADLAAAAPARLPALARRMNTRWVAVFDADADAPVDLFRHLAARILVDDSAMGFQGPVAPLANLDAIHPLCRMAGLWIAFSHATIFPRLMTKPGWARPLAGTNWCIRIDGYEQGGRLTRAPARPDAPRRLLLSFDPRHLTEDLEAGLRFYSDWRIAAEWHPHLEWEQAPPRPGDLVRQWRRWTLGTLQAMTLMLRSDLPLRQKIWLASVPVEVAAVGVGPALTALLWIVVLTSELRIDPIFAPLTVFLTCVNVLYAAPFIVTLQRFRRLRRARAAGEAILEALREERDVSDAAVAESILERAGARDAAEFGRLAREYLRGRSVDPAEPGRGEASRRRLAETPGAVDPAIFEAAVGRLADAPARRTPARWREEAGALVWAIPFLLFQLIPFYTGLARWIAGGGREWRKTPRTPKRG